MKTKILALVICVLGFMQNGFSQTNLLVNGDFESSVPDGNSDTPIKGWNKSWYPNQCGNHITKDAKQSGNCGLYIYTAVGTDAFSELYQDIKCKPASNYRVSASVRNPQVKPWTSGSFALVKITFLDKYGVAINSEVESDRFEKCKECNINNWRAINMSITTPKDAAGIRITLTLKSNNGLSVLNVDNCAIVQN